MSLVPRFDPPSPKLRFLLLCLLGLALSGGPAAAAPGSDLFEVKRAVAHDISAPLTLLKPAPDAPFVEHEPRAVRAWKGRLAPVPPDAVLQSSTPAPLAPGLLTNFPGIGDGFMNKDGSRFRIGGFPPDTDGDVGPNHYVQIVNSSFAVFNKTGGLSGPIYGAVPTNTLWSGFGGPCQSRGDGDGVVLYDALADRWFITQFAVTDAGPWFQCIAVSTTGDPTGQYARYAYQYDGFNDYGKFGVWPDAYYATYNSFNASRVYRGAVLCAFDRTSMLQGLPAVEQCFKLFQTINGGPVLPDGSNLLYGNILPTDLDGNNPPPAGAPNYMLSFDGTSNLQLWKFHVDWVNPANTTLTGAGPTCNATSCPPINIPVAAYAMLCFEPTTPLPDGGSVLADGGQPTDGTCVPQQGGQLWLDSLGDRPMFRASYRRFADHESVLLNHSVRAGVGGGVRWYELRDPSNPAPVVYQQGTYAPDSDYRWLGSMAMDSAGNIALAYSRSSAVTYPSIYFTARNSGSGAALGQMDFGEGQITAGGGPQNVAGQPKGAVRWGDYSNMSIDPLDDCTFWYTNEYIPWASYWNTTVASFQVPSCQLFTPSLNPQNGVLARGGNSIFVIVSIPAGSLPNVPGATFDLSVSGLPSDVTSSFTQPSISPGGNSQLTLAALPGTSTLKGLPVAVAATLRTTPPSQPQPRYQLLTLDVLGNEFSVAASPASVVLSAGALQQVTLQTQAVHGNADNITFAIQGGLPPGLSASFSSPTVLAGAATMLTLSADPSVPAQSSSLAIRATSPNSTHVVGVAQTTLTLPTASLDSPPSGTRLVGTQSFTVSGTVSVGTTLAKIEVIADGKPIGSAAIPSIVSIDTTQVNNGQHLFAARTTDANGGVGESLAVSMTVANPSGCGCSGAGQGVDAGGLCVALSFLLSRLARARAARRAR